MADITLLDEIVPAGLSNLEAVISVFRGILCGKRLAPGAFLLLLFLLLGDSTAGILGSPSAGRRADPRQDQETGLGPERPAHSQTERRT